MFNCQANGFGAQDFQACGLSELRVCAVLGLGDEFRGLFATPENIERLVKKILHCRPEWIYVGAIIIRLGFAGILCYKYIMHEPPKIVLVSIKAPI